MVKRSVSVLLAVLISLLCCLAGTASAAYDEDGNFLTPTNKCRTHPTMYCAPRYQDPGKEPQNLKSLSASAITANYYSRDYGLYFKFTPARIDNGFYIYRFDTVITDTRGNEIHWEGWDDSMECRYGYYWYWNFYNLRGLFQDMESKYGRIVPGTYVMNIYFNHQWAGKVNFKILK